MTSTSTTTATKERALTLLGDNVPPTMVAAALGVTDSAISQLLSDESFAIQVVERKYKTLLKHSQRDSKADQLEDALLDKLVASAEFLMDPMKIAAIYRTVNAAKRRGISSPESLASQQTIVQLTLPSVVINQYTQMNVQVNQNNQVIRAGNQELITVPSSAMDRLVSSTLTNSTPQLPNNAHHEQTANSG